MSQSHAVSLEISPSAAYHATSPCGRPNAYDRADAYVAAMRVAGAVLHPVRGAPGAVELDGTFTIDSVADAEIRRRVAAVEAAHAPRPADGEICFAVIKDEARRRFESKVGDDLETAMKELSRLHDEFRVTAAVEKITQDTRPEEHPMQDKVALAADIALDDFAAAQAYVLAMPIRGLGDLALKLEFSKRFCDEDQRADVIAAIEAFNHRHKTRFTPERITTYLAPRQPDQDVVPILATCIAAAIAAAKDEPLEMALQQVRESTTRELAATVGDDLTKALAALARMKKAKAIDCDDYEMADDLDEDTIDRVGELLVEVYLAGLDYILALPARSTKDVGRKAEFALRYCDTDAERRKVLFDIVGYFMPEIVGTLPDVPAILC